MSPKISRKALFQYETMLFFLSRRKYTAKMTPNNRPEKKFSMAPAALLSIVEMRPLEILKDSITCSRYFATSAYSSFRIVYRFVIDSILKAPTFL